MQDILQKLNRLEDKIKQMSQKIEYLRKENIMLIEENVKLKQDIEKQRGGSMVSPEKVVFRTKENIDVNNQNSEQLKRDLDKYIVEIDKCIELINNM